MNESVEQSVLKNLPVNDPLNAPGTVKRRLLADAIGSPFFWAGILPLLDAGLILASVLFIGRQRLGFSPKER